MASTVKREYAVLSVLAVLLLVVGLIIGRWSTEDLPATSPLILPEDVDFRQWFWERRTLDLITQVGLIFAGALGVAAILPGQDEGSAADAAAGQSVGTASQSSEEGG